MSFDRQLVWELEQRIAGEFVAKGVNVELGPVSTIPSVLHTALLGPRLTQAAHRWATGTISIHWAELGRYVSHSVVTATATHTDSCLSQQKAFTPDPYLSSTMSYIAIAATQSMGLVACAKHYFLYEQEPVCDGPIDDNGGRSECEQVHSMVDDKTIKELYLPSFAEAVRAGVGAVMCSYNRINDTPSCQSPESLNRLLKDELNFQGYVLSDFGATHSTVESVNAGMDQELPKTYYFGSRLTRAVKNGLVKEARLDDMVRRILTPWIAMGQADGYTTPSYQKWDLADEKWKNGFVYRNEHVDVRLPDSADFARRVAEESHVLLKNDDGVLPLDDRTRRIAVFGQDADYPTTIAGCGGDLFCKEGSGRRHWNGTVTIGGGSGAAFASYIVAPIEAIARHARGRSLRVDQVLADDAAHYPAIAHVAREVQVCIVFVSVFQVEGWDRATLGLDRDGEALIQHVSAHCAGDVVVVIHAGGQVLVEDWIDLPNVKAVIFAGYPGQETGDALANLLWGDVNPSGKLAFTMGKRADDWPPNGILRDKHSDSPPRVYFHEGVAIDYKWFDLHGIAPRYPFGHGLSYTTFSLTDLHVGALHIPDSDTVQPTNEAHVGPHGLYDTLYVAHLTVANTGTRAGAAVPQLYMSFPPSEHDQPPRHLRGYAKPYLEPGEAQVVEFALRKKDLGVWDVQRQVWRVPSGVFTFHAGTSSRDLVLTVDVEIE